MRTSAFRRNGSLEDLLNELNGLLGPVDAQVAAPERPQRPVILVVGPPRSGTTLLMQWLAASGHIAYPTNLLSRFFAAPYLGARVQQLLTDPRFNYRDELWDFAEERPAWRSDLGKTRGPLEPNEFWYFWRRFFDNVDPAPLTVEARARVDGAGFLAGLARLELALEGKPFATKGILLQYDLDLLADILDERVLFLHTVRDAHANIRSLLSARIRYAGGAEHWFSVRPPGTDWLLEQDPIVQVAGQVHFTHRSIEEALGQLPAACSLRVEHEAFCADPGATWSAIDEKLRALGDPGLPGRRDAPHFTARTAVGDHAEAIAAAWATVTARTT